MSTGATDPVVIVGSGLAGWAVARELRKLAPAAPVTLVTADAGDFYAKPMLSNAFAQGKAPAQLVTTAAAAMAAQVRVELRDHTRVLGIDRATKTLETDRAPIAWSRLVLALGADPIRLRLAGDAADAVLSVNDLRDYATFRAALPTAGRVGIIGAGLIGSEFANDLATAGHAVTVIDPLAYPLASLVPESAGRAVREALAAAGVTWRLGTSVTAVDRNGTGFALRLADGSNVDVDLVLSAVGLRPRVDLARTAGIAVDRGIVVDRHAATSDADVFAIGDCAQYEGRVLPYVLPIMTAARALARTLAGEPTPIAFPVMPVVVKTPACPVAVAPVAPSAYGAWSEEASGRDVKLVFTDPTSRVLGFALTGARVAERAALAKSMAG